MANEQRADAHMGDLAVQYSKLTTDGEDNSAAAASDDRSPVRKNQRLSNRDSVIEADLETDSDDAEGDHLPPTATHKRTRSPPPPTGPGDKVKSEVEQAVTDVIEYFDAIRKLQLQEQEDLVLLQEDASARRRAVMDEFITQSSLEVVRTAIQTVDEFRQLKDEAGGQALYGKNIKVLHPTATRKVGRTRVGAPFKEAKREKPFKCHVCNCSQWTSRGGCCVMCRCDNHCVCSQCKSVNKSSNVTTTEVKKRIGRLHKWWTDVPASQKQTVLEDRLQATVVSKSEAGGRRTHQYFVGNVDQGKVDCCKTSFCRFYGTSSSSMGRYLNKAQQPEYSDAQCGVCEEEVVKRAAETMTREEVGLAQVPQRENDEYCFSWMLLHFQLVGDQQPNRDGKVHLDEGRTKKEIWKEYHDKLDSLGLPTVNLNRFLYLWRRCFAHVTVRKHKGVDTKCPTCTLLASLRSETTDDTARKKIAELSFRHRAAFMGERERYYAKRLLAKQFPQTYASFIGDGMSSYHARVPHQSSAGSGLTKSFELHLQGVIDHGRDKFSMTVTFPNSGAGKTNTAIYTIMRALEKNLADQPPDEHGKKRLPPTIFVQIDGGSENANLIILAVFEILIHRGLINKAVLTRLMVGHTHEDVDSRFGALWKGLRRKFIYSPQKQARSYLKVFAEGKAELEYVWAVPDYRAWLDEHCENIGRCFKKMDGNQWTQHVFTLERISDDEARTLPKGTFPLNVRTTYRAYAQNEIQEIHHINCIPFKKGALPADVFEYQAIKVAVRDLPTAEHNIKAGVCSGNNAFAGMWVLHSLPNIPLPWQPLTKGTRSTIEEVAADVVAKLGKYNPKVQGDWNAFLKNECPQSDDVDEFVRARKCKIPLAAAFDHSYDGALDGAELDTQPQATWTYKEGELRMSAQNSVLFAPKIASGKNNMAYQRGVPPRVFDKQIAETVLTQDVLIPEKRNQQKLDRPFNGAPDVRYMGLSKKDMLALCISRSITTFHGCLNAATGVWEPGEVNGNGKELGRRAISFANKKTMNHYLVEYDTREDAREATNVKVIAATTAKGVAENDPDVVAEFLLERAETEQAPVAQQATNNDDDDDDDDGEVERAVETHRRHNVGNEVLYDDSEDDDDVAATSGPVGDQAAPPPPSLPSANAMTGTKRGR